MADEPTPRAQWNVKVLVNLGMLALACWLIVHGVNTGALTVEQALTHVGAAAFGGGVVWLAK